MVLPAVLEWVETQEAMNHSTHVHMHNNIQHLHGTPEILNVTVNYLTNYRLPLNQCSVQKQYL